MAAGADLKGKLGGAFGSYRHDVGYSHDKSAPPIILDTLQKENEITPFELGPFLLKEDIIDTGITMEKLLEEKKTLAKQVEAPTLISFAEFTLSRANVLQDDSNAAKVGGFTAAVPSSPVPGLRRPIPIPAI